jgi:hypothetical protein
MLVTQACCGAWMLLNCSASSTDPLPLLLHWIIGAEMPHGNSDFCPLHSPPCISQQRKLNRCAVTVDPSKPCVTAATVPA